MLLSQWRCFMFASLLMLITYQNSVLSLHLLLWGFAAHRELAPSVMIARLRIFKIRAGRDGELLRVW